MHPCSYRQRLRSHKPWKPDISKRLEERLWNYARQSSQENCPGRLFRFAVFVLPGERPSLRPDPCLVLAGTFYPYPGEREKYSDILPALKDGACRALGHRAPVCERSEGPAYPRSERRILRSV